MKYIKGITGTKIVRQKSLLVPYQHGVCGMRAGCSDSNDERTDERRRVIEANVSPLQNSTTPTA